MARKLVDQRENATYHVWSRCIEWRPMMKDEFFRAVFLEVIALTQNKYRFELNQYEILDNHIHMIIHTMPGEATISRIMQFLKSRFAERYNKLVGRIGPFWNERYSYSIIQDAKNPQLYFLWLLWYIAFNSVRKKFAADPRDYLFGGIKSYLDNDHRSPVKVTLHKYFLELGDDFRNRLDVLLGYESAYRKRLSWILDW